METLVGIKIGVIIAIVAIAIVVIVVHGRVLRDILDKWSVQNLALFLHYSLFLLIVLSLLLLKLLLLNFNLFFTSKFLNSLLNFISNVLVS